MAVNIDWSLFTPEECLEFINDVPKVLKFGEVKQEKMKVFIGNPPREKIIDVLRVRVQEEDGRTVIKYWNIAAKKAAVTLKPYILDGSLSKKIFRITKHDDPPKTSYSIEVLGER